MVTKQDWHNDNTSWLLTDLPVLMWEILQPPPQGEDLQATNVCWETENQSALETTSPSTHTGYTVHSGQPQTHTYLSNSKWIKKVVLMSTYV